MQTQAALTSRDEAIHEESKAQNKYDMHAQEAAYLAEGQARIVAELRETITQFAALPVTALRETDVISIGAVVTLHDPKGSPTRLLLGPRAGGLEVVSEGKRILVITPVSPLGSQLLGRRKGDTVVMPGRSGKVTHRIAEVV